MKRHRKLLGIFVGIAVVVGLAAWYFARVHIPVLQPRGEVGRKELHLIIFACIISAIIVIPVFVLAFGIAHRYNENNKKPAKYTPDVDGNWALELLWWLIPGTIIVILGVVIWHSSYALDPYRALTKNPEHIQVVATDGNWLFIYPKENFALQGFAWIPTGRSVEFDLTSDTVMTSFWVPSLGSQMYAMPGMTTKLNLEADKTGSYHGLAANISGEHFADQTFELYAQTSANFADMTKRAHSAQQPKLTMTAYKKSVLPYEQYKTNMPWGSVDPELYNDIVMNYMMPSSTGNDTKKPNGTDTPAAPAMDMQNMPGMKM